MTEYDICRPLSAEWARRTGREWAKPLTLVLDSNEYGRWDLKVNLVGKAGASVIRGYTNLVACALLKTEHDIYGRKCKAHCVKPKDQHFYEVDHWLVPDQCDSRLANLVVKHKDRHRGEGRLRWQEWSLPKSQRGLKRLASALRPRPAVYLQKTKVVV